MATANLYRQRILTWAKTAERYGAHWAPEAQWLQWTIGPSEVNGPSRPNAPNRPNGPNGSNEPNWPNGAFHNVGLMVPDHDEPHVRVYVYMCIHIGGYCFDRVLFITISISIS